jgi:hypothetical protein
MVRPDRVAKVDLSPDEGALDLCRHVTPDEVDGAVACSAFSHAHWNAWFGKEVEGVHSHPLLQSACVPRRLPSPWGPRRRMKVEVAHNEHRYHSVTDLQRPPSERTPEQKLWDFKTRAQQYARDRESCDDVRISYLEFLETEAEDDLALARMIAG